MDGGGAVVKNWEQMHQINNLECELMNFQSSLEINDSEIWCTPTSRIDVCSYSKPLIPPKPVGDENGGGKKEKKPESATVVGKG
jgi:hypothetical protein